MKSTPDVRLARPRPDALKATPVMLRTDLPVSLNTSLSWSPLSRLTPLNDESWAVVVICCRMLLYWLTSPARTACAPASATGAEAAVKLSTAVTVPPIAPPAAAEPSDEGAKAFAAEIVSLPVESRVAARLLACSAAFRSLSDLTVPLVPSPKVTLTATPRLNDVKVRVLPLMPPAAAPRAA